SVLHVSEELCSLDFLTIHQFHEHVERAEDVKGVIRMLPRTLYTTLLGLTKLCHRSELVPKMHPHLVDQPEKGSPQLISLEQR
ncbi:unnamed protein product, partial [Prunus brigantina]